MERRSICTEGPDLDEPPLNSSGPPEPGAGVELEPESVAVLAFEDPDLSLVLLGDDAESVAALPCADGEPDAIESVAVLPCADVESEAAESVTVVTSAVARFDAARLVAVPPLVDAEFEASLPFEVARPDPAVATGVSLTPIGQLSSLSPPSTVVPSFVPSLSIVNLAQLAIMTF